MKYGVIKQADDFREKATTWVLQNGMPETTGELASMIDWVLYDQLDEDLGIEGQAAALIAVCAQIIEKRFSNA